MDPQQANGATTASPQLPEIITLHGVSYSVKDTPELIDLIKAAGVRERAKLYSVIEGLKRDIAYLKGVEVVPDQPALSPENLADAIRKVVREEIAPLSEAQKRAQAESVDAYRARKIKENEGRCIPDYVTGKTVEEIDASLAKSIEVRASFPSPNTVHRPAGALPIVDGAILQQMNDLNNSGGVAPADNGDRFDAEGRLIRGNTSAPLPGATTTQTAPIVANKPAAAAPAASSPAPLPQTPVLSLNGMPDVKKMTQKEYAAKRDDLMSQLQQAVESGAPI
jgi:hypothetical protein